jgi:hypothetical protein
MAQILGLVCSVEAQVTDVDDGVRGSLVDVTEHGVPVLLRLRRTTRQVSVRHQDHAPGCHT